MKILLKELLKEQKLTREKLARECGISLRTLYYIESGERDGSFLFWINASKVLGIDINLFAEDYIKRKASLQSD